ncbi:hypothetical protein B0H19DRAFT_1244117 [Mycena capillaripes]|nr:hypothetical protein B0H19DRAFT_1244117 [Mycena capillaripes]
MSSTRFGFMREETRDDMRNERNGTTVYNGLVSNARTGGSAQRKQVLRLPNRETPSRKKSLVRREEYEQHRWAWRSSRMGWGTVYHRASTYRMECLRRIPQCRIRGVPRGAVLRISDPIPISHLPPAGYSDPTIRRRSVQSEDPEICKPREKEHGQDVEHEENDGGAGDMVHPISRAKEATVGVHRYWHPLRQSAAHVTSVPIPLIPTRPICHDEPRRCLIHRGWGKKRLRGTSLSHPDFTSQAASASVSRVAHAAIEICSKHSRRSSRVRGAFAAMVRYSASLVFEAVETERMCRKGEGMCNRGGQVLARVSMRQDRGLASEGGEAGNAAGVAGGLESAALARLLGAEEPEEGGEKGADDDDDDEVVAQSASRILQIVKVEFYFFFPVSVGAAFIRVGAAVKLNQHKRVGHTDFISPDSNKAFWTPPATPLRYLGSLSTGATGWTKPAASRTERRWAPMRETSTTAKLSNEFIGLARSRNFVVEVGIEITAESEGLAVYPAKVNQTLIWKYKWMRVARDEQPEGDGNMRKKSRRGGSSKYQWNSERKRATNNLIWVGKEFGLSTTNGTSFASAARSARVTGCELRQTRTRRHTHLSRRPPHIGVKLGCQKDRWESHSEVMRAVDAESVSISGPAADKSRNVQVGAAIDESNRSGTFPTARFFTLVEAPIIVHSPVLSEEDNIKWWVATKKPDGFARIIRNIIALEYLTKPLGVADWSTATIRKNKVPILYWEEYEDLGDFWVLKTCTIVLRDERPVQGLESRRSKREPVFRKFLVPIPVERLVKRRGTWWLVGTRQKTEPSNGALHYTFSLAIIICSTNFIICGSALTSTHQPELTKNVLGALYTAANFLVQSLTAQIEAPIS